MRDTKKSELRAVYPENLVEVKQKPKSLDAKNDSCCQSQPCTSKENKFSFDHYKYTPKTEDRSSQSFLERMNKPISTVMDFRGYSESSTQVTIHKRNRIKDEKEDDGIPFFDLTQPKKKVKVTLVTLDGGESSDAEQNRKKLLANVKKTLDSNTYKVWLLSVQAYKQNKDVDQFIEQLLKCFKTPDLYPLLIGRSKKK